MFGSPWVRMHCTNFKVCARAFCCSAGVSCPPFGSRCEQSLSDPCERRRVGVDPLHAVYRPSIVEKPPRWGSQFEPMSGSG